MQTLVLHYLVLIAATSFFDSVFWLTFFFIALNSCFWYSSNAEQRVCNVYFDPLHDAVFIKFYLRCLSLLLETLGLTFQAIKRRQENLEKCGPFLIAW